MKRQGWGWPITIALTALAPLILGGYMLTVEISALTDGTPDNEITGALRQALELRPDLFVLGLILIVGVTCFVLGVVAGHVFYRWGAVK